MCGTRSIPERRSTRCGSASRPSRVHTWKCSPSTFPSSPPTRPCCGCIGAPRSLASPSDRNSELLTQGCLEGTPLAGATCSGHVLPVPPPPVSRCRAVLGDLHVWIPVAVLLAGLLVLRRI